MLRGASAALCLEGSSEEALVSEEIEPANIPVFVKSRVALVGRRELSDYHAVPL